MNTAQVFQFRLIKSLLITLIISVFNTAVNAGYIEEKDGKTIIHITVSRMPNPDDPSIHNKAKLACLNLFKKRFPEIFKKKYRDEYIKNPKKYGKHNWDNIEIRLHPFSGITVPNVETDLLAIAGGIPPDVLYINFRKSHLFISNDFLYPLDEYFAKMSQEEQNNRIYPSIWPVIKRKGPKGNVHIWAMPSGGALGKLLFYRKDLFDQNRIPYPTLEWTLDDLYRAAKKIHNPKKGVLGIAVGLYAYHWMPFFWSFGAKSMKYDAKKDEWSNVFDDRRAAEALDYYIKLTTEKWIDEDGNINRGYASMTGDNVTTKWDRGQVGMKAGYINEKFFASINPEVVGITPIPKGPHGERHSELNSRMFGLFSQIKDVAVRDAAWEYMYFSDSDESMTLKIKIMVEGGLARFISPKYLKKYGYPELVKFTPTEYSKIYDIALKSGIPEAYGKGSNFSYTMMGLPIEAAAQLSFNDQLPKDREERLDVLQGILKKFCERANEVMIGKIPPSEMRKRRIVAGLALFAIIIAFGFVFYKITKTFTPPTELNAKTKSWAFKKYYIAYLILIPALLSITIWQYIPLIQGSFMAFYDYKLIGNSTFIFIDNFANLLFDSFWWNAVWNAMRYSFFVISLTFLPPVFLAILLQEVPRGKLSYRLVFYLPAMITGIVTVLLWKQFFDPNKYGTLNMIMMNIPAIGFIFIGLVFLAIFWIFAYRLTFYRLIWQACILGLVGFIIFVSFGQIAYPILFPQNIGFWEAIMHLPSNLFATKTEAIRWLLDENSAMLSCIIPMVWAGMGPGCLIYLAALKGIPNDYYEAADIDGASFIDKLLFIVFPTLKILLIINFVGVFIGSWYSATGNILVMTGGLANTETAGLHIWYKAFTYLKFGEAAAMAWVLGFMLIGFTVYQLRILSRVEFRTTGDK